MSRLQKIIKRLRVLGSSSDGFVLPAAIGIIIVIAILASATFMVVESNLYSVNNNVKRQQAFNISEAGINYYLWHLSHSPSDFKDGSTAVMTPDPALGYGPFVHDYVDDNGVKQGTYTLYVNPQANGSSVVKVRSIGRVGTSDTLRTIDAFIGAPSFASYGVVSDSALWFGNTETATGPVHSNQGVRMDGASTTDVTSANSTYVPSSQLGGNGSTSRAGVWCNSSVISPVNCNTRVKTDWRYPVPAVDFNAISGNLCTIKKTAFLADPATSALASGSNACSQVPTTRTAAYLPRRSSTFTDSKGYLIQLNTNGTYDLYKVDSETDTSTPYTSALGRTVVSSGITIPESGVIFAEDNVWVRTNPTYHGRVTIAAGRLATNANANIVVADDIVYSTKNGQDAIGLVAEGSVIIAPYAPPSTGSFTFEVDAAMIAQSGTVEYPVTYRVNSNRCTRGWVNADQLFNFYGSVATRQQWTWTWQQGGACGDAVNDPTNGYISGVENNNTQYDYNLLYAPPPSFPITSSYNILSWREVLTKP
jgi:type II secretory pathway pseudopilin PulG